MSRTSAPVAPRLLNGPQWNKNERREHYEAITAAYARGDKLKDIEARFGISKQWCKRIAKRMGATMRQNGRPKEAQ